MLKNTRNQYGNVSKFLHWGIFLLVSLMLLCGFFMEDLPESIQPTVYMCHKSTGILILGLMVLRLIWRSMNISPVLPTAMPSIQKFAAYAVHGLLYIILIAMPLDGWIMSTASGKIPAFYGLITIPFPGIELNKALAHNLNDLHSIFAYILLFLIVVHVAAALKHHIIDKDDILKRMMFKR
jgi:cytochrome b561